MVVTGGLEVGWVGCLCSVGWVVGEVSFGGPRFLVDGLVGEVVVSWGEGFEIVGEVEVVEMVGVVEVVEMV